MYRSFVTCDDPKGVVECGKIRASKSGSSQKMDHRIESHRESQRRSSKSLAYKEDKEEVVREGTLEKYHSPSSFQLLEISRGAQELNRMIDSWSKGLNNEAQPKDIAKDLLKGALDLQESLIMLGKLQEASQYMNHLKKKQKEKRSERGRVDEVVMGSKRADSCQFGDHNYPMGLQKPRLSADRSSRDCIEELKIAISDSLARQNLLPNKRIKEKNHFDRRRMYWASDIPSTSSSHSSVLHSNSSHSTDSYALQSALEEREKRPNLIAKLMGLEDIPSKPSLPAPQKQLDREKNLRQPRPNFEVEKPKVWKLQPARQKARSEERTLKEVLETMQFKGLLKSSPVREIKCWPHESSASRAGQRLINDIPPIVVIKPQRLLHAELEEALQPRVWEEGALSTKMMLRKMKVKEVLASKLTDRKEETPNAIKMHYKTEAEDTVIQKPSPEEPLKNHTGRVEKPAEKEFKTVSHKEGVVNANKMHKKLQAEETSTKRLWKEGGAKDHRDDVARMEDKGANRKIKVSPNTKAPNHASEQQQRKEAIVKIACRQHRKDPADKEVVKTQKEGVTVSKEPGEKNVVKPKNVSRSQDQAKVMSRNPRKPENGSVIVKNQRQLDTKSKTTTKHRIETTIRTSNVRRKEDKKTGKPKESKQTTEITGCKEDDKIIDLMDGNDSIPVLNGVTAMLSEQLSTEEGANISHCEIEVDGSDSQNSISVFASEFEKQAKFSEEADDNTGQIDKVASNFNSRNQLKSLLLSAPSFLILAVDLCHLNMNCSEILPTSCTNDSEVNDMRHLLDYANEFLERRTLLDTQTRHPLLLNYVGYSRSPFSLEQLVDEVCNAIETLESYHKLACEDLLTDCLYTILERDIRSKGVVNGMWDLGWSNGFSADEAEQAMNDLEKLLVSELIEEVFT